MTEHIVKLASGLPKDDLNGLDDVSLAEELWRAKIEHRAIAPRVAVVILTAREAKVAKDGSNILTLEVGRVQIVEQGHNLRQVKGILASEYSRQTGAAVPSYEVESITSKAFADLPRTTEEIDAEEADEQDRMSPTDELRRHLERVHGIEGASVMTAEEAEAKHEAEHNGELAEGLEHNREWTGWTRADIEASAAMADGDETPYDVLADENEAAAGGPDPDYGRDLDDEADHHGGLIFSDVED